MESIYYLEGYNEGAVVTVPRVVREVENRQPFFEVRPLTVDQFRQLRDRKLKKKKILAN